MYISKLNYVKVDTEDVEVARIMQKYDLEAIPVIDELGRLVGRITIDDIVDVIKDEADKVGDLSCALIEAGEVSGRLDESLAHLATITESRLRIKRKVRSAMMYPIVVLVIALSMATAMLTLIVPQFEDIYKQLGGDLPLPTRVVIAMSNAMITFWWVYPILLAAIVAVVVQMENETAHFHSESSSFWSDRS